MEDLSSKEDMSAVDEDPVGGFSRDEYVHDPMRVNSLESFGKIREKN